VLGLAFKPNTDDMRFAPSVDIIADLQSHGASVRCYDPHAMTKAKGLIRKVTYCKDSYSVCKGADCLVILTEWNEFKELDLKKVKGLLNQPVVVDGRNIYDPAKMKELGFRYFSIGRP
jgi:UDPglucose 6-dehydrogenase